MGDSAGEVELGQVGCDVHREVESEERARPRGRLGRLTVERLGGGACWLMVVLKAAGVRLSRAAAGRERSELALDRRMPAAYSSS